MRIRNTSIVVSFVLLLAPAILAEEAPAAPRPTAEHEALGVWVGTWEGTGEMSPGPFGPGGPMSWTEDCSWFAGAGFHVVCKSKGEGPMGPMQGLGIVGYDPAKKVYTHYGVDNGGWAGLSEGSRDGDVWTFSSTEMVEGETYHGRFTMTLESPKLMKFTWEMSKDGKTWTVMMQGTSKKE